jgi:hypothetical protein
MKKQPTLRSRTGETLPGTSARLATHSPFDTSMRPPRRLSRPRLFFTIGRVSFRENVEVSGRTT